MKGAVLQLLALAVIIANSAQIGFCEKIPCVKASCPDGPVLVRFQYSNCTGTQKFYSLNHRYSVCTNTTDSFEAPSSEIHVYNDQYYAYELYAGDHCGAGQEFPVIGSQRYYFGNCFSLDRFDRRNPPLTLDATTLRHAKRVDNFLGEMYLKNANQLFESPQNPVVVPNVPEAHSYEVSCSSIEDCKSKSFSFEANFTTGSCAIDGHKTYEALANVSAHTCYYDKDLGHYQSFRCANQHTQETLYSMNGDCSRPYMSLVAGGTCGNGVLETTYCTAVAPTPSSASNIKLSVLITMLAILSLIVL